MDSCHVHDAFANNSTLFGFGAAGVCDFHFPDSITLPPVPFLDWELPEIGDEPLVQTFFEGPTKCNCCVNWVEKPPKEIPIASQEKYQKAAIRIYKCKGHHAQDANGPKPSVVGGLTTSVKITSIEIQSPIIRREISPILAAGGREVLNTETIKISQPFQELYFAHSQINDILKNQTDGTKEQEHMQVMVDVMDEIFSEVIPEVSSLHNEKKITEKYLWTLFPKGITIYFRGKGGEDRLCEAMSVVGKSVKCRFLDSDGTTFGWREMTLQAPPFIGIKKILSLEFYPIGFHADKDLEKTLAGRGLRVLKYQDVVHCQYRSPSFSFGAPSERIVVDCFGRNQYSDLPIDVEEPWETEEKEASNKQSDEEEADFDSAEPAATSATRPSAKERDATSVRLRQNQHWLCFISPLLGGYSFSRGNWGFFNVDHLQPISWNFGAMDRLVFPEEQKDLLQSFVVNYNQSISYSGDVIRGKGKGLVVLLSGAPGTGKTLTVEAVAEKARRPLYRPSVDPLSLSRILGVASTLATEYGAILLLDEADVFLQSRSAGDGISRNEMVAEMLRELEYYVGIVFLTTNLLEGIDHAFLSRIHIHLRYPDLSDQSRLTIWKDVLHQKPEVSETDNGQRLAVNGESGDTAYAHHGLPEEDLLELARWQLNGREIKNVIKVGRLWCLYTRHPLSKSRLETVITMCGPGAVRKVELSDEDTVPRKRARMDG